MEMQQKDSKTLTTYIHRFKKEAKHCDFNLHPAKIRIFLKGLINSSRIAPSVYEKGPTTIEDAIGIVEKISLAQCIAVSFSQNHQISMMKRGPNDHNTPNQDCSNCGQLGHPWFTCLHIICDVVTSTDTVGTGYHHQEQPAHPRTITTMGDDHHTLSTPQVNVMTGEAAADPMLGYTRETGVQVTQDTPAQTGTPAGTETQDGDTHQTATEPRADSGQATIDHRLCMPGIILGVDHPHATMTSCIDIA